MIAKVSLNRYLPTVSITKIKKKYKQKAFFVVILSSVSKQLPK